MELKDFLPQLLGPLGTLVFSLVIIWAFLTEKIVPKRRLDEVKELLLKSHEQAKEGINLSGEIIREEMWRADVDRQLSALRGNLGAPPREP